MEKKKFFDVFQTIKLNDELTAMFEYVDITKIATNVDHTKMRIYIESSRLIEKSAIFTVRDEIARNLRTGKRVEIEIIEKYSLSSQYTEENLFEIYKDSVIMELNAKSPIVAAMFKKAPIRFDENKKLIIDLEQSIVSEARMKVLKDTIEKIFRDRFDMPLEVKIEKKAFQQNRFAIKNAKRLQNEVNVLLGKNQNEEETKEEKQEKVKPVRVKKATYSQDPDMVYGRDFKDEGDTKLSDVFEGTGETVVRGQIMTMEDRETRNGKFIVTMEITDFTDSIAVKIFLADENVKKEFYSKVKKNSFVRIKGVAMFDTYDRQVEISRVDGMKLIPAFSVGEKRKDTAVEKRLELHCHTKMSEMDGVSECKKIVRRAYEWGHKAIAITDHGVVQAFPDAWHEYLDIKNECKKAGKECDFKVIYGVEAYLVDDLKDMIVNPKGQGLHDTFVVFDLETTGFSAKADKIIEIGAVKVEKGKIVDRFSTFVNPQVPIPFRIEQLTSINDNMVIDAPTIEEILPKFMEFCKGAIMVAHNADFDMSFISANCNRQNLPCDFTVIDTVAMSRYLIIGLGRYKLDSVAKALGIVLDHHHRAVDDARVTAEVFLRFVEMLEEQDVHTLAKLNDMGAMSPDLIKKAPSYHGIILVKNETGRINLNRLVSASHLDYFNRRPRMPESLIQKYREGLILGSACEAGELFQAVIRGKSEEELAELVRFYDYLEIQPIGNNMFMLESDRYEAKTVEDLQNYNRKIVELGERYHKPVVATCDVHFLNPEDEQYRRILMAGKGFSDADNQAPLYFRTTEEMLEEFAYLGEAKAKEVVITNTNKIADMIEKISPVHPDKCPPVIPKSDETLTKICYDKAHEIYGPDLPDIVEERLQRELNSIISNGFAVMYIIAQKLVWDSNDHGYLVGSRGSVGSSFVATMAGITEVNPLSAHYICPKCHYVDFDSDAVRPYSKKGMSGCDMPDRDCPVCGTPLQKEGHDIPFETFLGFKGNKEPDIDLNFSGEYQSKAHKYVEVIFGEGKAFRAGTIGTLAEKTAYGYVYKYFEERDIHKRRCEMERLAEGCTGVKRTTGQHPGGIIVVPHEHEIYEFTAIQHPANDVNTDIITTHFEYHSIDHNLLKLDILGHDDPTMIRRLEDLTGMDATTIPLDDPEVMSLFHSTDILGITPEDIGGIEMGSLGVPEFGTEFVMQMLKDTNPKCFSDLVRISGLSHGTDVWLGNAQTLIEEGKAEISTAICCRDDIMTYLINMGLDKEQSFTIMESVRKGKGLKPEWEEEMTSHGVPDWYIWSCKKIKYMFPKAHAAAYVMMGWRVAWFKVHKPLAYYAAYFGIRASAFSYEIMCRGKERLDIALTELLKTPKDQQTKKDQDTIRDGRIAQEMYARGFEFMPIDIYKAKARECQIIDGKIMPPLSSVEGLGDKACEQVEEAAKHGPFTSLENFRNQAKVSKTNVDKMVELGILTGLPETDQLTFDFFMAQSQV